MAKTLPEETGLERIGKGNEGRFVRTMILRLSRGEDRVAMLREAKRWRRIGEDNNKWRLFISKHLGVE